jgi:hypothetical protein
LLKPFSLVGRIALVVPLTHSTFSKTMALDWTFRSQPNADFDAQFLGLSEPGLYQDDHDFLGSLEWVHNTLDTTEDETLNLDPAPISVEPWTGLGCTCGLSFIACSEHDTAVERDDVSALSDVASWNDNAQATQGVQQGCATTLCAHEHDVPHNKMNIRQPQPREGTREKLKAQKKRRAKISAEAKCELEKHFTQDPYPSGKELERLSTSTKLSYRTVSMWFSNSRARRKICHRK